jgi:hypothetical protein
MPLKHVAYEAVEVSPVEYEQGETRAVLAQAQWSWQRLKMEIVTVWSPQHGLPTRTEMQDAEGTLQTRFAVRGDWVYTLTHEPPPTTTNAALERRRMENEPEDRGADPRTR